MSVCLSVLFALIVGLATGLSNLDTTELVPPVGIHIATSLPPYAFKLGMSASAVGDVNGDDHDDVAICADYPFAVGRCWVIYGPLNKSVTIDDSLERTDGFVIVPPEEVDSPYFGRSITPAGDLNGDGIDDFAIGALYTTGLAFIIFGSTTRGNSFVNLSTEGVMINGGGMEEQLGQVVSGGGDVNGDNINDLLIGAPSYNGIASIFVAYGKEQGDAWLSTYSVNSANVPAGFGRIGVPGRSPSSLAFAGDTNGDGFGDIVSGASSSNPKEAFLIFGTNETWPSFISTDPDPAYGVRFTRNPSAPSYLGKVVAGGCDINSDGFDDIMIGDQYYGSKDGTTYVIFGRETWASRQLDASPLTGTDDGFMLIPDYPIGSLLELSLPSALNCFGDINGDGHHDLAVSIINFYTDSGYNVGIVQVVYGRASSATWTATVSMNNLDPASTGFNIKGSIFDGSSTPLIGNTLGFLAGDLNDDGLSDLVIGASGHYSNYGRAHVVFSKCPDGYYTNKALEICTICDPVCITCEGQSTRCTACQNGTFMLNYGCYEDCGVGYYNNSETWTCDPCVGCLTCSASTTTCTTCVYGTFLENNACGTSCNPGHFPNKITSTCDNCTSSCSKCSTLATNCTGCVPGTFLLDFSCEPSCGTGFIENDIDWTCDACAEGCSACSGLTTTCTSCKTGWHLEDSTCVVTCSPGRFLNSTSNTCDICTSPCNKCSTAATNCTGCVPGKFLLGFSCEPSCGTGFIENGIDWTCDACAEGCSACSGLTTTCTSCKTGWHLEDSTCVVTCSPGRFLNSTSNTCDTCTNPCSTCSKLATNCTSCTSGLYVERGYCTGSCSDGTFANAEGVCEQCQAPCVTCVTSATNCTGIGIWTQRKYCTTATCTTGSEYFIRAVLTRPSCNFQPYCEDNVCWECINHVPNFDAYISGWFRVNSFEWSGCDASSLIGMYTFKAGCHNGFEAVCSDTNINIKQFGDAQCMNSNNKTTLASVSRGTCVQAFNSDIGFNYVQIGACIQPGSGGNDDSNNDDSNNDDNDDDAQSTYRDASSRLIAPIIALTCTSLALML